MCGDFSEWIRSNSVLRRSKTFLTFIKVVRPGILEETGVAGENRLPSTNFLTQDPAEWDLNQEGETICNPLADAFNHLATVAPSFRI